MTPAGRSISRRSLIKGASLGLGAVAPRRLRSDSRPFRSGVRSTGRRKAPCLSEEDLLDFYRRLPNADRQFVVLAGASHAVALGYTRNQLWHVMRAFLEMPERATRS